MASTTRSTRASSPTPSPKPADIYHRLEHGGREPSGHAGLRGRPLNGTMTAPSRRNMAQVNLDKALEAGREAVGRHAWREAFELLTAADQAGGLNAADLEGLAEAAWWNGRVDLCISARERAFALYLDAGEPRRAALVALDLAKDNSGRKAAAVGAAWHNRAQRLLQDEPVGVEHGFLSRREWMHAHNTGNYQRALELAKQTLEIGTRFGNADLMALGLQDQGLTLVAQGDFNEGMALLDQATVAALSG